MTGKAMDDGLVEALFAPLEGHGDRYRQIVIAAAELLNHDGLDGLTIRAVLGRTGLSRRAYYECFADKDDLVLAIFEHVIALAVQHYEARLPTLPDAMARLEFIVTCVVLGQTEPLRPNGLNRIPAAMSREHLRLAEARPAQLQAALDPLTGLIAAQIGEGMAAGLVRPADPAALATLCYNLVSTTVHVELMAGEEAGIDPTRRAALAEEIWEFVHRAIRA